MNHLGTQTLETERLILRRFQPGDAPAMFRNWAGDPKVTEYLIWPAYSAVDGVADYLRSLAVQYDRADCYDWAIVLKAIKEPIGSIGVVNVRENVNAAEVGYCIGRKWWRQGLAPEALRAVARFLFREVGINRLEAKHDARNPASGAVMKKCGMTYEGTLRQAARYHTGICDACWYGLLREEFLREPAAPAVPMVEEQ